MSRIDKSIGTESRLMIDEDEERAVTTNGQEVSFWADENVLNCVVVMAVQLCKYSKIIEL